MLLLLLSRFSRVRLCATPETAAHQAPPFLGFSRQEHWNGLPFPSPMHERKSESEDAQSCSTLRDPMDCSPPGSSAHGIFQARVLEWGAIAFSRSEIHENKIQQRKETKQSSSNQFLYIVHMYSELILDFSKHIFSLSLFPFYYLESRSLGI